MYLCFWMLYLYHIGDIGYGVYQVRLFFIVLGLILVKRCEIVPRGCSVESVSPVWGVIGSCQHVIRDEIVDHLSSLDPDVSLFPVVSTSVWPAKRAKNFSIRWRMGSDACLIRSSTDLSNTSMASARISCRSVSEELSSVWVSTLVLLRKSQGKSLLMVK